MLHLFPWIQRPPRSSWALSSLDPDEHQGMLADDGQVTLAGPRPRGKPASLVAAAFGFAKSLAASLVPSFFGKIRPSQDQGDAEARHLSTSSLDGLRGFAALAVINYHILYAFQPFVFYGYGLSEEAAMSCARPEDAKSCNYWFHQLPVLRLVYTGTWPISIFFVISGFALSAKPLKVSRNCGNQLAQFAAGAAAVASGLLRRPIRLYGPPVISTLFTMLAIWLGAYEHGRRIADKTKWISVINETHHVRFDAFGIQFKDWLGETWRMLHVFWWGDIHNKYDVHLWTIATECRCSLAVFLVLPMYIAIQKPFRRFLMVMLIVYVYTLDRWDVALFFSGLLIADSSIDWQRNLVDKAGAESAAFEALSKVVRAGLLGAGLLLLSAPDFCVTETPAFRQLGLLIPSSDPAPFRFLPNLGGILVVALVAHTAPSNPLVSMFLNSALPQYLGRVSFSLYIVHGPLVHIFGYLAFPMLWNLTGTQELWRYTIGFIVAYSAVLTAIVCVADLFWRTVDAPCVRFAKAIHERLIIH